MAPTRSDNQRLRRLLVEAGLTQAALAHAVNRLGAQSGIRLHYDRTAVAHWLSGTRPRPPVPQLVSEVLSRRLGRLVTPAMTGLTAEEGAGEHADPLRQLHALLGSGRGVGSGSDAAPDTASGAGCGTASDSAADVAADAGSGTAPGATADAAPGIASDPVPPPKVPEQRGPSSAGPGGAVADADAGAGREAAGPASAAGAAPTRPAHPGTATPGPPAAQPTSARPPSAQPASPQPPSPEPASAGSVERATMQSATAFFAASLDAHGGGRASGALTRYLADDTVAWLRRASTPAERTALLVEASRLALLLARMDADGREHACAQDHFALAERLAEESGEAAAQAVVLRMLSTHAGRLGRHRQALRTAETATRTVPDSAGPERAFVLAQLAVARASCAERRGALRALSAAEHTVESAEEGEGPFGSYPRAALDFQTGEVLHALGDETAALRAWQRSLDARAYADRRGRALTHGRIAAVLLNAGRAEEATAHLHKARPLLSGLDSLTAHHMIRDLQHRTRTYRRRTRNGPTGNGT